MSPFRCDFAFEAIGRCRGESYKYRDNITGIPFPSRQRLFLTLSL